MNSLPKNLEQAIRILKWLNNNLRMGEASLKYLEKSMIEQYNKSEWNQSELNNLRITMYCTVNCMLIWYTSFVKEYKGEFKATAINHNREQYIDLNRQCTPYFATIDNIFPNLDKIRNTILAHGYRLKDKSHLKDIDIDNFMNEITNRGSLLPYYQVSNITNLVVKTVEKVYGHVNEELVIDEGLKDLF